MNIRNYGLILLKKCTKSQQCRVYAIYALYTIYVYKLLFLNKMKIQLGTIYPNSVKIQFNAN
jgi:hypothetical protein